MIRSIQKYFEQHLERRAETGPDHFRGRLRTATAVLLLEMARADFQETPEEIAQVRRAIQVELGLSDSQIEELMEMAEEERLRSTDYFQFTALINKHATPEEKAVIVEMMWRVAMADGRLDTYEEHLIRKIANLLHVRRETIVAARRSAQRDTGFGPA